MVELARLVALTAARHHRIITAGIDVSLQRTSMPACWTAGSLVYPETRTGHTPSRRSDNLNGLPLATPNGQFIPRPWPLIEVMNLLDGDPDAKSRQAAIRRYRQQINLYCEHASTSSAGNDVTKSVTNCTGIPPTSIPAQ